MWKIKIPLVLVASMVICLVLTLTSCKSGPYPLSTSVVPSDGGSISPSEGLFKGEVTIVATPAQYYEFSGWAGDASGNTNPLTIKMNSGKQIDAQFSKIKYPIQVTSNPPDGGTISPGSATYDAGNMVTFTATAANGYRFLKWGGDAAGSTNPLSILVDGNKDVTANFIK
jgi:hypothetical protein